MRFDKFAIATVAVISNLAVPGLSQATPMRSESPEQRRARMELSTGG